MSRCVYVGVAAASLPPRCVHGTLPTAQNQSLSMSGSSACPVPLQPMQDSRRLVGEGGGVGSYASVFTVEVKRDSTDRFRPPIIFLQQSVRSGSLRRIYAVMQKLSQKLRIFSRSEDEK
jgi:hypothetical protein